MNLDIKKIIHQVAPIHLTRKQKQHLVIALGVTTLGLLFLSTTQLCTLTFVALHQYILNMNHHNKNVSNGVLLALSNLSLLVLSAIIPQVKLLYILSLATSCVYYGLQVKNDTSIQSIYNFQDSVISAFTFINLIPQLSPVSMIASYLLSNFRMNALLVTTMAAIFIASYQDQIISAAKKSLEVPFVNDFAVKSVQLVHDAAREVIVLSTPVIDQIQAMKDNEYIPPSNQW